MNAQSLIADGLHSIFAFLDAHTFILAITRICHHWSAVSESRSYPDPPRSLRLLFDSDDSKLLEGMTRSPLRRHLARLTFERGALFNALEWSHIISYCPSYSCLAELILYDISIQADLEPLIECTRLTHLSFTFYAHELIYDLLKFRSVTSQPLSRERQEELDSVLEQMRDVSSIPNLKTLSINDRDDRSTGRPVQINAFMTAMVDDGIIFERVTQFSITWLTVTHRIALDLVRLTPHFTNLEAFALAPEPGVLEVLSQLTQLTRIWFHTNMPIEEKQRAADAHDLALFTQLEAYRFDCWSPNQEEWAILGSAWKNIVHLDFTHTEPQVIEFITATLGGRELCSRLQTLSLSYTRCTDASLMLLIQHFIHLTSLDFENAFASLSYDQLYSALNDPAILPRLTQMMIYVSHGRSDSRLDFDRNKPHNTHGYRGTQPTLAEPDEPMNAHDANVNEHVDVVDDDVEAMQELPTKFNRRTRSRSRSRTR